MNMPTQMALRFLVTLSNVRVSIHLGRDVACIKIFICIDADMVDKND